MLSLFLKLQRQRKKERILSALEDELRRNFDNYHVMDQVDVIKPFSMDALLAAQSHGALEWDEILARYKKTIHDINELIDEYLKYQKWFSADADRRNRENAKNLTAKQDKVKTHLTTDLLAIINETRDHYHHKITDRR